MLNVKRSRIKPAPGEYDYGLYSVDFNIDSPGRFDLSKSFGFNSHRSGWGAVLENMSQLHSHDGIMVDTFIEKTFGWMINSYKQKKSIPYTRPWVGFIHNPVNVPEWYKDLNKLDYIFSQQEFIESMKFCRGIYTLSTNLQKWLLTDFEKRFNSNILINSVLHPYVNEQQEYFTLEKLYDNTLPMILDIGTWLRKQTTLYNLSAPAGFKKVKLWPRGHESGSTNRLTMERFLLEEIKYLKLSTLDINSVSHIDSVSDIMYDHLLSKNIVMFDCWDSSANNTLVECIERHTPVLCPLHPAIIEYVGIDYPLLFEDVNHASELLSDMQNISKGYEYLKKLKMSNKLSIDTFIKNITNSEIYQSL